MTSPGAASARRVSKSVEWISRGRVVTVCPELNVWTPPPVLRLAAITVKPGSCARRWQIRAPKLPKPPITITRMTILDISSDRLGYKAAPHSSMKVEVLSQSLDTFRARGGPLKVECTPEQ